MVRSTRSGARAEIAGVGWEFEPMRSKPTDLAVRMRSESLERRAGVSGGLHAVILDAAVANRQSRLQLGRKSHGKEGLI